MSTYVGRYRILRTLGEGGMGRVFLAEAAGPGGFVRRVVVKVVRDVDDPALRQALVDEARIAAVLVHKNIVPVLDLDEAAGERLVILEHVDGLDLRHLLERTGALPQPLAVFVAAEVAAALDYAHRRADGAGRLLGLVHRDVGAANVLVSWEGEVKLTDFGVAGLLGDGRIEGVRGNLAYMAPEQASGGAVDARVDVFALGILLRELLVGANPFADDTSLDAARGRRLAPLPPGAGSPGLESLIARATAPDPERRFPSAAALRQALLALPGRPVDAARELAAYVARARRGGAGAQRSSLDASALKVAALGAGRPLTQVAPPAPRARTNRLVVTLGGLAGFALMAAVLLLRRPGLPPVVSPDPPAATVAQPAHAGEGHESPPPPAATAARPGTLSVNAIPWARIFVDGRAAGQTPRLGLAVRAGTHTVRLVTAGGEERQRTVYVAPGRDTRLTIDFSRP
jgi:hypothetical protein